MESNIEKNNVYLKTMELTFFKKLLQVYWISCPKSWRLDEFILEDGILTVKIKNGNTIQSHLSKIACKYSVDNYDRYEFFLKDENGKKLHFKEIPWMLSDGDWELIRSVLPLELSTMGKTNNFLKKIKDFIKDYSSNDETEDDEVEDEEET
jgi:hypothetical protein